MPIGPSTPSAALTPSLNSVDLTSALRDAALSMTSSAPVMRSQIAVNMPPSPFGAFDSGAAWAWVSATRKSPAVTPRFPGWIMRIRWSTSLRTLKRAIPAPRHFIANSFTTSAASAPVSWSSPSAQLWRTAANSSRLCDDASTACPSASV